MKTSIFKWKNRKIGKLTKDKNGFKKLHVIRKPKHYFRKYQGFGFNKELIQLMIKRNVKVIQLDYHSKNSVKKHFVNPKTVLKKGIEYNHKDFEPQLIIKEKDMILQ